MVTYHRRLKLQGSFVMKYISSLGLIAGSMLLFVVGCATKPEPPHYTWNADTKVWRDADSGIVFPEKVGNLVKTGEYQFLPNSIYGRAVAYELPGTGLKICVYVYRYGLDNITDCRQKNVAAPQADKNPVPAIGNPMLENHRQRVIDDLKKAHEDDMFLKGEELSGGFYFSDRSRLDYTSNQLSWNVKNEQDEEIPLDATVMITAANNNFIKIQANYFQVTRPNMLPVVGKFQQQFLEQILGVELGYPTTAKAVTK